MTYADIFRPRSQAAPVPVDLIELARQQVESVIGLEDPYAYLDTPPPSAVPTGPFGMSEDEIANLTPRTEQPEVSLGLPELDIPEPEDNTGAYGLEQYFGDVSVDPFGNNDPANSSSATGLPNLDTVSKALDGVRKIVRPGFGALVKHGAPALDYDPKQAELNNMLRRLIRGMQ